MFIIGHAFNGCTQWPSIWKSNYPARSGTIELRTSGLPDLDSFPFKYSEIFKKHHHVQLVYIYCSHLQLLWDYIVGMLTNWAELMGCCLSRSGSRIDLSQEFHRIPRHLKRNSKELKSMFIVRCQTDKAAAINQQGNENPALNPSK